MKFLFSPVTKEQASFDMDGMFVSTDGSEHNYQLAYDQANAMITLTDSCGRMVPMDVEDIPKLIDILIRVDNYVFKANTLSEILHNELVDGAVFAE
jgi:hypothetical protein